MTITQPAFFMNPQEAKHTVPQVICEGDLRADLQANRKAPIPRITMTEPQDPPLRNAPKNTRESHVALPTFIEIV
jgi:hypothetical protein